MIAANYFVQHLMAPVILIIGLIGNTFGLTVLVRKNMINVGPRNMYRYLFIMDTLYLVFIIINYLTNGFNYDLTLTSKYFCKLYWYLNFVLGPISPYIMIYLSIEKLLSIKYPSKKYFLRTYHIQLIYFIGILAFNFVYYLPVLFTFQIDIQILDNITVIYSCNPFSINFFQIVNIMDFINRVAIPFLIMTINSCLIINSIFRIRQRIAENFLGNKNSNLVKNMNVLFSLFFLSIIYIALELPLSLFGFISNFDQNLYFFLFLYLGYLGYAINFYIIILSNSLFRKEFISLFKK